MRIGYLVFAASFLLFMAANPALAQESAEFVMVPAELVAAEQVGPDAEYAIDPAALAEYARGVVAAIERDEGLAALTLSMVHDDQVLLAKGFGLADIEAGRPVIPAETLFRIGSVSKTFTWTAVMMLVERGLLDLDTDINQYLIDVEVREAFGEPVTMRHLMHHRAGFEDSLQLFAVADDDPRSLSALLSRHQPQRIFPPGQRTSYSNWGSALAAQLVEDVSRVDYGEFLRTEILDPLGMNDTGWLPPGQMDEATRARLATGYRRTNGAFDRQGYMQIGPYWPAGGMASTATDMARWMRFHLNGGELEGVRLLQADTHERMWTRGFNDRPDGVDVAHGFQDRPYRGIRTLGHGGGTAAYLTQMVMAPELDLGIFLSYNSTHTPVPFLSMPDLLIDQVIDHRWQPVFADQDEEGARNLKELAGTYLGNRRVFASFAALFGLMNTGRVTPMTADSILLESGGQAQYLRRLSGDVFEAADGQRIAFLRDERDRVVALADGMGVHTAEKVGWLRNPTTFFVALALAGFFALTSTLGAWRNFGREMNWGFASRMAGAGVLVGVMAMVALIAGVINLIVGMADFDISRMAEFYPGAAMYFVHYAGWAVAVASGVMLVGQWPAWSGSSWSLMRRLHFALFTLVMLFLALMLWQWRVIGAPVI